MLVLEPGRAERHYWRDLWAYRELFAILAWRDVAVRYKQTVIGVAWAVVRPFLTMVVFTDRVRPARQAAERGRRALSDHGVCRHAALVPVLHRSSSEASNSLVGNANLDRQGLFPAHHHPGLVRRRGAGRFRHQPRHARRAHGLVRLSRRAGRSCCCPFFVVLAVLASLGPALFITALNVKYRDFRYIIPFIVQFGLYVSPVGFSSAVVPEEWRLLVQPQSGGGRDRRLPLVPPRRRKHTLPAGLSCSASASSRCSSGSAFAYFRRTERTFADLI